LLDSDFCPHEPSSRRFLLAAANYISYEPLAIKRQLCVEEATEVGCCAESFAGVIMRVAEREFER